MGQLKLTLRQRAALAAANSQAATASQLTPPTSDVNMDGVETHPHQQKYTLDQAATSFEIMQIKTQLEKYGEDIAENEAMVTNTGNKVERLEGDIEAVDKATGNRFLDEEILRQKLSDQVEDSLDEFYEFKKEMDKK
ncbi:uncharacterized protein B0J16DRAFT_378951 [Fusarium flagelliforme]|uniref:uncharacterized protein n=1 Tax=Fusarium flagelliforme TaxID=2675880 RepID=UPI001E8D951A|nr:uncharacterized protein B0J16DRAFT_378951 [Fusarium flagelliforme]KAH7198506.1 hypothetical protein B0J16DRAFT_378951 [Fusarium flagelliforme]